MNRGKLIVISGPSGVGKTTICNSILKIRPDIRFSISATSRPKRKDEKNDREYIFLSEKEFKEWMKEDYFIEYAIVHDNFYGTPKQALEKNLSSGYHVLLDVDVQGAKKLMQLYHDGLFFLIIPPDMTELEKRLLKRNTDKAPVIKNRLTRAREELKCRNDYKYVIENRELEMTVKKILSIIEQELGH